MSRWSWCFGCGEDNPIGLHLKFKEVDGLLCTEFIPAKEHQGYDGIVHGGIIATLLDEAMGKVLSGKGVMALTATLSVKFKKPIKVGDRLSVCSKVKRQSGRKVWLEADVKGSDGNVLAHGESLYIIVEGAQ